MRIPPCAHRRSRAVLVALGATAFTVAATVAVDDGPADALSVHTSSTSVTVTWRGNGHGHGLSQYGARGAAIAGLSYRQILAFYYPHTALVARTSPTIRVLLADFGPTATVEAWSKMHVTGVSGALPTAGVSRYRLVADKGAGLTLQILRSAKGSGWTNYRTGLANRAAFTRGAGHTVRVDAPDGSSNRYWGRVRAVRTTPKGAGAVNSVNVLNLESYTAGVAPREMPDSWQLAAVEAQAVAARTYGQYAIDHPRNPDWDICDTTACQFYGGAVYYSPTGRQVWVNSGRGQNPTRGVIATYRGKAIFAQFSASNGGWTVAGGQPYLVARADPYDTSVSGDPYLAVSRTVSTASMARHYKLSKVTRIVTTTNGHGAWGGRTVRATVYGVRAGKPVTVGTSGFELADALGAWTDWYRLVSS